MGNPETSLSERIIKTLQGEPDRLTARCLAERLGEEPSAVNEALYGELLPQGVVERDRRWRFGLSKVAHKPSASSGKADEADGGPAVQCWACATCIAEDLTERLPNAAPSNAIPLSAGTRRKMEEVLASGPEAAQRAQVLADELASCGIEVQQMLEWAAEMEAERQAQQATLEESGRIADVWVLCDAQGNLVRAQVANGSQTACWELLDAAGTPNGNYLPYRPQNEGVLHAEGFQEVSMKMPAKVMIVFGRTGAVWPRVELVVDPDYLPIDE